MTLIMTIFMVALSIPLSSSKTFIPFGQAALMEKLMQQNKVNISPMSKPTNWYVNKANKIVDEILQSFKEFTEMKVFDPIQIKIKQHHSKYYSYPEDSTKNHYFLG